LLVAAAVGIGKTTKLQRAFAVQGEGNSKRKGVGRVWARESIGVGKQKNKCLVVV